MIARTRLPEHVHPAHPGEIRRYCRDAEVPAVAPDFFQDLLNIARDRVDAVVGLDELEQGVWQHVDAHPEADGKRLLEYNEQVRKFLHSLAEQGTLDQFPGAPIEKAAALLKYLSQQSSGTGGSGDGFALPIFMEKDGKEVAEELKEKIDCLEKLDAIDEKELDVPQPAGGGLGARHLIDKVLALSKHAEYELIRVSQLLDTFPSMSTKKKRRASKSQEPTSHIRTRSIRSLEELPKILHREHALPEELFWKRAVEKQVQRREYVKYEEQKQLIYILVDSSGSMDSGGRIQKAAGVVYNRLKAVLKDEAEIYIRFFDSSPKELQKATTAAEARQVLKGIKNKGAYSGGGTNFKAAIDTAVQDIHKDKNRFHACDIVMVTDGEDQVRDINLKGLDLHVFSVGATNHGLKSLARKYVNI